MRWDRGGNNNEGEWPGAEPEQEMGGGGCFRNANLWFGQMHEIKKKTSK